MKVVLLISWLVVCSCSCWMKPPPGMDTFELARTKQETKSVSCAAGEQIIVKSFRAHTKATSLVFPVDRRELFSVDGGLVTQCHDKVKQFPGSNVAAFTFKCQAPTASSCVIDWKVDYVCESKCQQQRYMWHYRDQESTFFFTKTCTRYYQECRGKSSPTGGCVPNWEDCGLNMLTRRVKRSRGCNEGYLKPPADAKPFTRSMRTAFFFDEEEVTGEEVQLSAATPSQGGSFALFAMAALAIVL